MGYALNTGAAATSTVDVVVVVVVAHAKSAANNHDSLALAHVLEQNFTSGTCRWQRRANSVRKCAAIVHVPAAVAHTFKCNSIKDILEFCSSTVEFVSNAKLFCLQFFFCCPPHSASLCKKYLRLALVLRFCDT